MNTVLQQMGLEKTPAQLWQEAKEAGMSALKAADPIPMTVTDGTQNWHVEGGVCGFAWVSFKHKGETGKFLNYLKKLGLVETAQTGRHGQSVEITKSYGGGFSYWVSEGGQSMQRKEAFAFAMSKYLRNNGIECYAGSRMD